MIIFVLASSLWSRFRKKSNPHTVMHGLTGVTPPYQGHSISYDNDADEGRYSIIFIISFSGMIVTWIS